MKRLLSAGLVIASLVAIPAPVSAGAGSASCSYDGTYDTVNVMLTGDVEAHIARDATGHVTLGGVSCGMAANMSRTDTISITGDSGGQNLFIHLANGGFRPGQINEPGKSDEIEFAINLGGGGDMLRIEGNDAVQKIDIGQGPTQFGVARRLNLNAGETTGVDTDVTIVNVETILVVGLGGADVIRARGLKGTGPDPLGIPLWVFGGNGNDLIRGGDHADHLDGGLNDDTIYGHGHDDTIYLNDGQPGDKGYGGAGTDTFSKDAGDTAQQ